MSNLPIVQSDPFTEMEQADEQAVLAEIKGRAMDALVYEIQQGGQLVTGLSLAGVRETTRVMNANGKARIGISEREPIVTETDEYFEVKVFAADTLNGGGYWGIKRQSKSFVKRDGTLSHDSFALEKALAKAQRNALRGLIPEWFVREMITAWRAQGKAKTLNVARTPIPPRQAQDAPSAPPATNESSSQSNGNDSVQSGMSIEEAKAIHAPQWRMAIKLGIGRAVAQHQIAPSDTPSQIVDKATAIEQVIETHRRMDVPKEVA